MKRFKIQHLHQSGHSAPEIHEKTSLRTVERVIREPPIVDIAQAQKELVSNLGRPKIAQPFEVKIRDYLALEPKSATIAILQRLKDEGYVGGKTAVYEYVRKLRDELPDPMIARFEGAPGEYSQHDFGQHKIVYESGVVERVHFFVSKLKYSRLARVRVIPNENIESLCNSLIDAFSYFEGMPIMAVFDNAKTIVTSREGKHIEWNETFAQFCCECRFAPEVTWPRHPQEKGAVENLVKFAKSSFFKVYRFKDRKDLLEKLELWHRHVNDERKNRATSEVPRTQWLLEKLRLRPMPVDPKSYGFRYSRLVRTDGMIEFEGKRFFVGARSIGQTVAVCVREETLEITDAKGKKAIHRRVPANGKYSVLPGQREELLVKSGARPFVKRQFLMDLCPAAHWIMTEIRHRRLDTWKEDVDALYQLLEQYGEEAVKNAMIEAASRNLAGAEYVEAIVTKQMASEVTS